jgi:ribonuclease HII
VKKTNHKKRAVPEYTIGIDEVGRGPLAGPVCVGAVALLKDKEKKLKSSVFGTSFRKGGIKVKFGDSKQLTEAQRRYWAAWRRKENIPYAVVCVSPSVIDKVNISKAANRAAQKALEKVACSVIPAKSLSSTRSGTGIQPRSLSAAGRPVRFGMTKLGKIRVIADAGIKIDAPNFVSFPKADELVPAVSLASIIAKLHRDAYMKRLHKKHAVYDFITNKGYGTRAHRAALVKHGPSTAHRLTFLGKYATLKKIK